jgi:hypothetical protein
MVDRKLTAVITVSVLFSLLLRTHLSPSVAVNVAVIKNGVCNYGGDLVDDDTSGLSDIEVWDL